MVILSTELIIKKAMTNKHFVKMVNGYSIFLPDENQLPISWDEFVFAEARYTSIIIILIIIDSLW